MTTYFPINAFIHELEDVSYQFPTEERVWYDYAPSLHTSFGEVSLAHPAFIVFYKLTMNRNGIGSNSLVPKQDDKDLIRLYRMGLLNSPEFMHFLKLLARENQPLYEELMCKLNSKLF